MNTRDRFERIPHMTRVPQLCLVAGITAMSCSLATAQAPAKAETIIQACQSLKRQWCFSFLGE